MRDPLSCSVPLDPSVTICFPPPSIDCEMLPLVRNGFSFKPKIECGMYCF